MLAMAFVMLLTAICLVRTWIETRRRRAQSWEDLVGRLEPGWNPRQLGECLDIQEETPAQRWERLRGARGLYVMFQNAKVMLEMADYAARHGSTIDCQVLAELRSDALQIRVSVGIALSQYALHQLNDRICSNGLRAASLYKQMSVRIADLLQVNGVSLSPQFAASL